jgi:hypothetical protein
MIKFQSLKDMISFLISDRQDQALFQTTILRGEAAKDRDPWRP